MLLYDTREECTIAFTLGHIHDDKSSSSKDRLARKEKLSLKVLS